MDSIDTFNLLCRIRDELSAAGLVLRGEPDCSGQIAVCGTTHKPYGTDGRYAVHLDFPPNVWLVNYHDGGEGRTIPLWRPGELEAMPAADRTALRERIRQEREAATQRGENRRKKAAETANRVFRTLPLAGKENAYMRRKEALPLGDLRQTRDGRLVVPVRNMDGKLVSLQFIDGKGGKRFLSGGEKKGCFFPVPARDGDKGGPLLIGEGVATVLSACQATGYAGLVAFDAGNLLPVAEAARSRYPERELVLLADNDCGKNDNPGVAAATAAARAVDGLLTVPPAHEGRATDFNDLHVWRGLEAVRQTVEARKEPPLPGQPTSGRAKPPARPPLHIVNVAEFLSLELPERELLLSPVLPKQGLVMLHAARGIGKTFMGLSIAYAVAAGGGVFGRWQAPTPARVLYLDGEMPARTLQTRIASIVAGSETEPPAPDFLRFLTPDLQGGPMPNLATEEGQIAIDPFLKGISLVVVDNLATLARHGRSNDEESWIPVQGWLLDLRRRGLSVLLIHHQGKGGDQRGTSAKEDILDTVIRLDRPRDYSPEQGAIFEVHLTKGRGIFGDDAKPFEAQLHDDGHGLTWLTRDIEDANLERLRRLLAEGSTIREAAEEMGISKSAAGRLKKKLDALEGRISQGTSFKK